MLSEDNPEKIIDFSKVASWTEDLRSPDIKHGKYIGTVDVNGKPYGFGRYIHIDYGDVITEGFINGCFKCFVGYKRLLYTNDGNPFLALGVANENGYFTGQYTQIYSNGYK